jgi:CRP-like cAMP-binding protein
VVNTRPPWPSRERERWVQILQECPLFQDVATDDLRRLLGSARRRALLRGDFFFLEGDPSSHVYVLVHGKVRLVRSGPQGREAMLGFIEPGEPFGYVAAWAGTVHRVSAQAAQVSRALSWEAAAVSRFMTEHPGMAFRGLRLMAQYVEGSWDRLEDLTTGHVEWRIARALLRLAHLTERPTDVGSAVSVEVREQDVAELVGSTAYTVSRILSAWKRLGIVDVRREHLILYKPDALREIPRN